MSLEKVVFGNSLPGYEIGDKSAPAVIILQEWWGITDDIKQQAVQLNKEGGYRCLAPDLYKGKLGVHKEEAQHLMENLDFPNAVAEVKSAQEYLRTTGSPKVGVVGFCMGGALALASGQHSGVDCAVVFYGTPPQQLCQPPNVKVPVQGHFGAKDVKFPGFSDIETARSVFSGLPDGELLEYENADHAFMNTSEWAEKQGRKEMGFLQPVKEEQERAWKAMLEFFSKHLK